MQSAQLQFAQASVQWLQEHVLWLQVAQVQFGQSHLAHRSVHESQAQLAHSS